MKETVAVFSGSFDPITSGHLDLLYRGLLLFDRVWVAVSANGEKHGLFTADQRVALVKLALNDLPADVRSRASTEAVPGLLSDFCREKGATVLLRGARSGSDYDYEQQLAGIMRRFDPILDTVVLPSEPNLSMISSTYVRELLKYGHPLGDAVPPSAAAELLRLYEAK